MKYKTSITGKTSNDRNTIEVEFSVPLKHLGNFWRTSDIPVINCEVSLTLTWTKNCVLADMTTRDAEGDNLATNALTYAIVNVEETKSKKQRRKIRKNYWNEQK